MLGDAWAGQGRLLGDGERQQWRSLSRYLQISAVISSGVQHAPKPFGRPDLTASPLPPTLILRDVIDGPVACGWRGWEALDFYGLELVLIDFG